MVPRKGIPIGNLTSQLFANVYMNELDQFIKHVLKIKNYVRYTDDFVMVSNEMQYLEDILPKIVEFLETRLALRPHPKKIIFRRFHQGVDFLGYVTFPSHRLIRAKTRERILKKTKRNIIMRNDDLISAETLHQSLQSYLGVLSHANAYRFSEELKNEQWLF